MIKHFPEKRVVKVQLFPWLIFHLTSMRTEWLYGWKWWFVHNIWSRMKCLNNHWIDCHEILSGQSWSPKYNTYWLWWFPDLFFSSNDLSQCSFNIYFITATSMDNSKWCPYGIIMLGDRWRREPFLYKTTHCYHRVCIFMFLIIWYII